MITEFEVVFYKEGINENAQIKIPGSDRISLRIIQTVGDSDKVHSIDIKMFTDRSGGSEGLSVMLYVDPDTMLIDRKRTEDILVKRKNKDTKDKIKLYRDNVDVVGGAILYAKEELKELFDNEKSRKLVSYENVDKKMSDFSNLYKTDKKEFKDYIEKAKGKEELKEDFEIDGKDFTFVQVP